MKKIVMMLLCCLLFPSIMQSSWALVVPTDISKEKFEQTVISFYMQHSEDVAKDVCIVESHFANCKKLDSSKVSSCLSVSSREKNVFFAPCHKYKLTPKCQLSADSVVVYYIITTITAASGAGADIRIEKEKGPDSAYKEVSETYVDLYKTAESEEEFIQRLSSLRVNSIYFSNITAKETALLQAAPTIQEELNARQQAARREQIVYEARYNQAIVNLRKSLRERNITETLCYRSEELSDDQQVPRESKIAERIRMAQGAADEA